MHDATLRESNDLRRRGGFALFCRKLADDCLQRMRCGGYGSELLLMVVCIAYLLDTYLYFATI